MFVPSLAYASGLRSELNSHDDHDFRNGLMTLSNVALTIAFVLVFILVCGFFAAAEMAMVSLRESQIRRLGRTGRRGARVAKLAREPNRFLPAVQVGVTVATVLSAALGAETLAAELDKVLLGWGLAESVSGPFAFIAVTAAISYVTLVLGELAPKRIGRQRAESLSLLVAPFLDRIATLSRPVSWLLSVSTDGVV